jgi:hypothetical protein
MLSLMMRAEPALTSPEKPTTKVLTPRSARRCCAASTERHAQPAPAGSAAAQASASQLLSPGPLAVPSVMSRT